MVFREAAQMADVFFNKKSGVCVCVCVLGSVAGV